MSKQSNQRYRKELEKKQRSDSYQSNSDEYDSDFANEIGDSQEDLENLNYHSSYKDEYDD